jgi:hypothetical protein
MKLQVVLVSILTLLHTSAFAQDQQAKLAEQLSNPVASLINVPIQYTVDEKIGPTEEGEVTVIKASPVVPFELNEDWNIITRTIIPVIETENIPTTGQGESGLGDIAASVFFSPKAPTSNGWIWGVGTILLLDTAREDELGSGKWGIGPTAILLKQSNGWTFGVLTHYLVDVAGDDNRADVEQAFLQPFLAYIIDSTKTTFSLQSEATRDLESNETNAFALLEVGQMFKVGSQIMQARIGVRHWYESEEFGAEGTTLSLKLFFIFPK